MLDYLKQIEKSLPQMLRGTGPGCPGPQDEDWNSLLVDYHHPHVWRLWRQWSPEIRVLLHKIHPCEEGEALLHPHPWPAAMRIFLSDTCEGYETGVGWGHPEDDPPSMPAKFVLASDSTYEMTDYRAWHYVRPIGGPIYSLMVIGPPFDVAKQKRFGQYSRHESLSDAQRKDLLRFFRAIYYD